MTIVPERHFEWVGKVLRLRVGFVYPIDQEPENLEGVIPYRVLPGDKVAKFYLPPVGVDLMEVGKINYRVPASMREVPHGQLVLNKRPECTIRLAREGEEEPFGFEDGERYTFLRVYRKRDGGFEPLFIEVQKDFEYTHLLLTIKWEGNDIQVVLKEVDMDQVPDHLKI